MYDSCPTVLEDQKEVYVLHHRCNEMSGSSSVRISNSDGNLFGESIRKCESPKLRRPTVATCKNLVDGICGEGFSDPSWCDTCNVQDLAAHRSKVGSPAGKQGVTDQATLTKFMSTFAPDVNSLFSSVIKFNGECDCCRGKLEPSPVDSVDPNRMWGLIPTKNKPKNKKTGQDRDKLWLCSPCYLGLTQGAPANV